MPDDLKQFPQWPRAGDYKDACERVLAVLGAGLCDSHEICEGCKYELDDAVGSVKAALGQPVSRQKCGSCGALDSIWWARDPDSDPVPWKDRKMWCHVCGAVEPEHEFVDLPME